MRLTFDDLFVFCVEKKHGFKLVRACVCVRARASVHLCTFSYMILFSASGEAILGTQRYLDHAEPILGTQRYLDHANAILGTQRYLHARFVLLDIFYVCF